MIIIDLLPPVRHHRGSHFSSLAVRALPASGKRFSEIELRTPPVLARAGSLCARESLAPNEPNAKEQNVPESARIDPNVPSADDGTFCRTNPRRITLPRLRRGVQSNKVPHFTAASPEPIHTRQGDVTTAGASVSSDYRDEFKRLPRGDRPRRQRDRAHGLASAPLARHLPHRHRGYRRRRTGRSGTP